LSTDKTAICHPPLSGSTFTPLDFADFIATADNPLSKGSDGKPMGLESGAVSTWLAIRAMIVCHNTLIGATGMARLKSCRALIRNVVGFESLNIAATAKSQIDLLA
jgi:hypothetical protein